MQNITKRQAQILSFIEGYIASHSYAPSIREIAKHFRIVSLNAVRQHLLRLENAGALDLSARRSRGISLPGTFGVRIPVVGRVAAGVPIMAQENIESYFVTDRTFLRETEDVFALKIKGDSMEPEMHENDWVLVKRQDHANLGELVVAVIENEATVKKLVKVGSSFALRANNPKYADIEIGPNFLVNGKVVGLIRKF